MSRSLCVHFLFVTIPIHILALPHLILACLDSGFICVLVLSVHICLYVCMFVCNWVAGYFICSFCFIFGFCFVHQILSALPMQVKQSGRPAVGFWLHDNEITRPSQAFHQNHCKIYVPCRRHLFRYFGILQLLSIWLALSASNETVRQRCCSSLARPLSKVVFALALHLFIQFAFIYTKR